MVRINKLKIVDGHNYVHGRLHGFKWRNQWEVIVTFNNEKEAIQYRKRLEQEIEVRLTKEKHNEYC